MKNAKVYAAIATITVLCVIIGVIAGLYYDFKLLMRILGCCAALVIFWIFVSSIYNLFYQSFKEKR